MLRIHSFAEQLQVPRDGLALPLAVQNASPKHRPFLHPLLAPDGLGSATEDAPEHHAWQHGLYFGLNDVNGVGFWTEGLHPPHRDMDGRVYTLGHAARTADSSHVAQWSVDAAWRDQLGRDLLTDSAHFALTWLTASYHLDIRWQITAAVDVHFGRYDYGGLFLRMPVYPQTQPVLLTSEGHAHPDQAEGRRARWVALAAIPAERRSLPKASQHLAVALMDHPGNFRHPTPWRADSGYGVGPSPCIAGPWTLARGESVTLTYRALITIGRPDATTIESSYLQFKELRP